MGIEGSLLLILIVFVNSVACGETDVEPSDDWSFKRSSFPEGFVFGTATSAYQYEGAWNVSGKGLSNWDHFTDTYPERIKGNTNGKVAVDFYNLYPDDVKLMKNIGFDAVRISLSWARILPSGRKNDDGSGVNRDGLEFYHNLINYTISKGVEPFVTLFHFDIPQALEDEYGGFLNYKIVKDFHDYADLCFREFGDKVKYWITINEPWTYTVMGFAYGSFPPGRCSNGTKYENLFTNCPVEGESGTEPYDVTHNLLLAHAHAATLYKRNYQTSRDGKIMGQIGIVLVVKWMLPFDPESEKDIDATSRALDFMYGWFMEPLKSGSYPSSMVDYVGDRLPKFSYAQSELVKGSYDFLGLNYYTAHYVKDVPCPQFPPSVLRPACKLAAKVLKDLSCYPSYMTDSCSLASDENKDGQKIGPQAGSDWLYIYPPGLGELLIYTKNKYDNPVIYITENGVDKHNEGNIQQDFMRTEYHKHHLQVLHRVITNKTADVRGYFVWSFLDNFEWAEGYTVRFGLVYLDYRDSSLSRFPKDSAVWFKNCLAY